MNRLFYFIGAFVGSWVGWAIGARFSFFAAFLLSIVGTGVGIYAAARVMREYF
ncbi:MAG TPA: hypothetical protein VFI96_02880 [Longimicrobiaceae bacterium]|nr:hypothetical protein [Longimicrobiaceae bacterium]